MNALEIIGVCEVEVSINSNLEKAWDLWAGEGHLAVWNTVLVDWNTKCEENDFRVGGKFCFTTETSDSSEGFHFTGVYANIKDQSVIEYKLDDGRTLTVNFTPTEKGFKVNTSFDPDAIFTISQQISGWKSFLNAFKGCLLSE